MIKKKKKIIFKSVHSSLRSEPKKKRICNKDCTHFILRLCLLFGILTKIMKTINPVTAVISTVAGGAVKKHIFLFSKYIFVNILFLWINTHLKFLREKTFFFFHFVHFSFYILLTLPLNGLGQDAIIYSQTTRSCFCWNVWNSTRGSTFGDFTLFHSNVMNPKLRSAQIFGNRSHQRNNEVVSKLFS